mgnify:FL=1
MRILMTILIAAMMMLLSACSSGTPSGAAVEKPTAAVSSEKVAPPAADGKRVLVVYFSRADENTGVGVIEKGNTRILAEMAAERLGADLFEIKAKQPYPKEYRAATEFAKQEKEANARPALVGTLPDLTKYDTVFLGYPIWWGDLPMPVYTFLEKENFAGKTILPFCTHEGSGISGTEKSIADVTKADVKDGFELQGHIAQNSPDEARAALYEWMTKAGY